MTEKHQYSVPSASPTAALWKVADVAGFLSMSPQWVYKQAELGTLPCIRMGASLRFDPSAIRKYLAQLQRNPASILEFRK